MRAGDIRINRKLQNKIKNSWTWQKTKIQAVHIWLLMVSVPGAFKMHQWGNSHRSLLQDANIKQHLLPLVKHGNFGCGNLKQTTK